MKIDFNKAVLTNHKGPILTDGKPTFLGMEELANLVFDAPNELISAPKRTAWAISIDQTGEVDLKDEEIDILVNYFNRVPGIKGTVISGIMACFSQKD